MRVFFSLRDAKLCHTGILNHLAEDTCQFFRRISGRVIVKDLKVSAVLRHPHIGQTERRLHDGEVIEIWLA